MATMFYLSLLVLFSVSSAYISEPDCTIRPHENGISRHELIKSKTYYVLASDNKEQADKHSCGSCKFYNAKTKYYGDWMQCSYQFGTHGVMDYACRDTAYYTYYPTGVLVFTQHRLHYTTVKMTYSIVEVSDEVLLIRVCELSYLNILTSYYLYLSTYDAPIPDGFFRVDQDSCCNLPFHLLTKTGYTCWRVHKCDNRFLSGSLPPKQEANIINATPDFITDFIAGIISTIPNITTTTIPNTTTTTPNNVDFTSFSSFSLDFTTGTSTESSGPSCDIGWERFGNNCYLFSSNKASWSEGFLACSMVSSLLASIVSEEENLFITKHQVPDAETPYFWIGLCSAVDVDYSIFTDLSFVNYTNWKDGEPDYNGECVAVTSISSSDNSEKFKWMDENASSSFYFVCKKALYPYNPFK